MLYTFVKSYNEAGKPFYLPFPVGEVSVLAEIEPVDEAKEALVAVAFK